jgi:hypothetical protein
MKLRSESYPDRIRRIAQEVSQLRNLYQVDHSVEKLRMIANELEQVLKKNPLKKAGHLAVRPKRPDSHKNHS